MTRYDPDHQSQLAPGLYIVATPIGNLGDLTLRAIETLRLADVIACEDSRVTSKLLHHLGIRKPLHRYDDHSSDEQREKLLAMLAQQAVALVSDAGTPLISDPGFKLVRAAAERGLAITTLPGACAAIAGLTLSGLPTDRFMFAGFLPAKAKARQSALAQLAGVDATLIFYESGPRLAATLDDMAEALPNRDFAIAREITKLYEDCRRGSATDLAQHYHDKPPKGEIVVMAGPPEAAVYAMPDEAELKERLMDALSRGSASKAAAEVAKATGVDRRTLYAMAARLSAGRAS